MAEPIVVMKAVTKTYPQDEAEPVTVLKGVNLTLSANTHIAIKGKSGSGKSTILHLMAGLDSPTNGEIYFKNKLLSAMKPVELNTFRNRHIGFIFQFHYLLPEFSALENVMIPAMVARQHSMEIIKKKSSDLLDWVELSSRMNHRPSQLSGGEQQRVAIARALINQPELIFADEPTGNLDDESAANVMTVLNRIKNDYQSSLIMVTHNPEIATLADHIYELENGVLAKK